MPCEIGINDPYSHGNWVLPIKVDPRLRVVCLIGAEAFDNPLDHFVGFSAWDVDSHFISVKQHFRFFEPLEGTAVL
jgi:hypothetical protein